MLDREIDEQYWIAREAEATIEITNLRKDLEELRERYHRTFVYLSSTVHTHKSTFAYGMLRHSLFSVIDLQDDLNQATNATLRGYFHD